MTDRELLEKAAKAAGIEVPKKLNNWLTYGDKYGFQWWNMDGTKTEKTFNPLNDDGDALRLAVKLKLVVDWSDVGYATWVYTRTENNQSVFEPHEGDPYAATRRAIVKAAAVIGDAM